MHLLLTRAVEDATRTQRKLEASGHSVILSPVMETIAIAATWPTGVIDALVATSGHAFGEPLEGLTPETRRVLPLYLVGARTRDIAQLQGFLGEAIVAKNAASLAMTLGRLIAKPPCLIYLAGRDRKPDLETALDVIGQSLTVIEVYEARKCDVPSALAMKALNRDTLDGILHFSRRSASLFIAAASEADVDIGRPTHFCLSEDVAAPLREAGCAEIRVSEGPNEADLLALVDQFGVRNSSP